MKHKKSQFGVVVNWPFHLENRWVVAGTGFLVDALVSDFNSVIISTQDDYERHKQDLTHIVYIARGVPEINFDTTIKCTKAILISDPHYKADVIYKYLLDNEIDYVLGCYKSPFFYHFKDFPKDKFVHLPWAIPDHCISEHAIAVRRNDVAIFGAKNTCGAYDIRNWCREQDCVIDFHFSGCENKVKVGEAYYEWLTQFDAAVAAGSSDPQYDLVTPKYFEIAAAGALLIGQWCHDLSDLGFNERNSVIFTKDNFIEKVEHFKNQPEEYITIRQNGRELIKQRHKISDRISTIKQLFFGAQSKTSCKETINCP